MNSTKSTALEAARQLVIESVLVQCEEPSDDAWAAFGDDGPSEVDVAALAELCERISTAVLDEVEACH